MNWQPIETAPRTKFVLVYCPEDDTIWFAKMQGGEWHGVDEFGLTRTAGDPTYSTGWKVTRWMPLPEPPK